MKNIILILCVFTFNFPLYAADISGQLSILDKSGNKRIADASNAVVYLTGITTAAPEKHAKLLQKNKQFYPRVLTIIAGQTVDFWNHDRVQHNVFSTEPDKRFDLGRYGKQEYKSVRYDKAGMYKTYCNIHQKMIADIVVLENKYFSKTDTKGNFRIKNVPPGSYQLHVWHIFGGQTSQTVSIDNSELKLPLQITSTKVTRDLNKHNNKFGRQYSSKKAILGDLYGNSDDF